MLYRALLIAVYILLQVSCVDRHTGNRIQFTANNKSVYFNHGITANAQTIELKISANRNSGYLMIDNPHINKIKIINNSDKQTLYSGDRMPHDSRPIPHRFFIFPIPAIDSSYITNITLDKSGENLSYGIHLMDQESLGKYLAKDNFIIGLIVGVYGLAILISIIALLINPTQKYIFFLMYMITSLVWIFNDAGLLFEFIWPNSMVWHNSSRGFFSSITMILFAIYLSNNDNRIFTNGVKKFTIALLCIMMIKFFLTFIVSRGLYPDTLKMTSMYFNGSFQLTIFMYIFLLLVLQCRKYWEERFEIFGILAYCSFVIMLAAKELGLNLYNIAEIHGFYAMIFFPVQCLFMSIHIYKKENEKRKYAEKAIVDFKINQQKELDKLALEVEENEKKRIAQNIHDEIGSIFVSLKYRIKSIREKWSKNIPKHEFDDLISLSEQGIKSQYSIIDDLLLELKSGNSLKQTIENNINLLVTKEDIAVSFEFLSDENQWSEFQKNQLFRIISELLTNTIKHSKARLIKLTIKDKKCHTIDYFDDGHGFDAGSKGEGRGLSNIRTRVSMLRGSIEITSNNKGTRVLIEIPIEHD